jgi:acetyltransferase-like isoleucine patch superfamily enzyme
MNLNGKYIKRQFYRNKAKNSLMKLLCFISRKNPILWKNIGRGVILSRLARINDSRDISLGSNVWIEEHATLSPMGGKISIGDSTHIHPYAILMCYGGDISIGSYCTVNPFCVLYGHGGLTIGDAVRIATHTVIIPANHIYDDLETPIRLQGIRKEGVVIHDDVWIGAGVKILDGVTIGKGSIIAAGAVVSKNVSDYAIVAGVPGQIVGRRGDR